MLLTTLLGTCFAIITIFVLLVAAPPLGLLGLMVWATVAITAHRRRTVLRREAAAKHRRIYGF